MKTLDIVSGVGRKKQNETKQHQQGSSMSAPDRRLVKQFGSRGLPAGNNQIDGQRHQQGEDAFVGVFSQLPDQGFSETHIQCGKKMHDAPEYNADHQFGHVAHPYSDSIFSVNEIWVRTNTYEKMVWFWAAAGGR